MRLTAFIAVASTAFLVATGQAQSAPTAGARYVTRSYGATLLGNGGPHFGLVRDRRVFQSAVQAEWVIGANRALAVSTTVEALTALLMRPGYAPEQDCFLQRPAPGTMRCFPVERPGSPVAAFGFTPLGLKLQIAPASRVRPFVSVGGGFIVFDRETPVVDSRRTNFAAEFIVGAEMADSKGANLSVAWKFQHWSNGGTAYMNPGIDANLLYVGIRRRRN
jgi:hypothetical protein